MRRFRWPSDYFGEIPAGDASAPRDAPPPARCPTRSGGWCSRIASSCRACTSPGTRRRCSPTATPSSTWSADLLASGKTSRLYRALVYEQRIATEVAASQNSREAGGFFQIVATAAPGRSLAEVERAIIKEIAGFIERGPTAEEMDRCLAQAESQFIFRLQTVGGFGGKSDQLNAYNVFLGEPGYFHADLARYRSATAEAVAAGRRSRRCCRVTRVVLSVVPRGRRCSGARPARSRWRCRDGRPIASQLPVPGPERPFPFPGDSPRSTLPTACASGPSSIIACRSRRVLLLVPAGASADPADRPGLAAITADMLDEGSGDCSALEVHEALGRIGAQLDTDVGSDATVVGLTTLERFLDRGLALVADMVVAAAVRAARLRSRAPAAAAPAAAAARHAAGGRRSRVRAAALRQPSLRPSADRHRGVAARAMTVDDIARVSRARVRAGAATLIAVGDATTTTLAAAAQRAFDGLERRDASTPIADPDDVRRRRRSRRRGWSSCTARRAAVGAAHRARRAAARARPTITRALVANMILGGQFVSRINLNLREDKGYTYGARTAFDFRRAPGPFVLQVSVQTTRRPTRCANRSARFARSAARGRSRATSWRSVAPR